MLCRGGGGKTRRLDCCLAGLFDAESAKQVVLLRVKLVVLRADPELRDRVRLGRRPGLVDALQRNLVGHCVGRAGACQRIQFPRHGHLPSVITRTLEAPVRSSSRV